MIRRTCLTWYGFACRPLGWRFTDLFDPLLGEDMMAATDAFSKTQTPEQLT